MRTAAYGGKGFKGRAAVSGDQTNGAASCRQQHTQVSSKPQRCDRQDHIWSYLEIFFVPQQ